MAVLSALNPTLADWMSRFDDEGLQVIIEMLNQQNEILQDATMIEGNLPTGHKTVIRTGLPAATWRLLNYGVPNSKSTTAQVIDACGMLEAYAEIDKALADLNGNTAQFRMSEDMAFLESMNQTMATTIFYGNQSTNPERFTGLAPRFNSLTANNGGNIIDAGGTGSTNTSLWLVCWDPSTCHMIFPKGSKAGLQHRDLGEWTLSDGNGGQYQGYRTHYKWDAGLSLRDWRYVVRIANIDVTALSGGSPANLLNAMVRALNKVPNLSKGRWAFYCNRTVRTWLDIQCLNKTNLLLAMNEYDGKHITTFRGIPIRTVDAILNTESRVV